MEQKKENNGASAVCFVCKKVIKPTSLKSHLTSKTHLNNVNKSVLKKKDLTESTKVNILRATKIINDIINDETNNIKPHEISKVYDILIQTYKLNTIENYLRLGLINNKQLNFTTKQSNDMNVFMKNIQQNIYRQREQEDEAIKDIDINEINNDVDSLYFNLIELYKKIPVRASEFIKIKIVSYEECTKDANNDIDTNFNFIVMDSKTLILNNTKTSKYDEVNLNDDVIEFITHRFSEKIDCNKPIFNKTLRTFERLIKQTGHNSQQIRKIYANSNKDDIAGAARLLNHSIGMHLSKYVQKI